MAEEMEDLFASEVEIERALVERVREELPNLKAGELPGALRNIGVSKALNVDKSAPLRGRPNQVVQHDYEGALEGLRRLGLLIEDDSAEEIPIAELPDKIS
jgi:hypothetical protein